MGPNKGEIDAARRALDALKGHLAGTGGRASCVVHLYAHVGKSKPERWRRMKFDAGLALSFRAGVLKALSVQLRAKDEVEPFTFDDMVSGHIGFWKKSESKDLENWFNDVPAADWPHVFNADDAFLKRVKFHATLIPIDGRTKSLVVFRHRGTGSLLHKGGLMALFDVTEHQFHELPGKVFHFDHGADFVEWDGWIYILDYKRFESVTNIRKITAFAAESSIKRIPDKKDIIVPNISELSTLIASKPLLARMVAAAETMGILAKLNGAAMAERIDALPLPIKYKKRGNTYHFTVDPNDASQLREFVNLITDYYLQSPVTKTEYRVPSKYPA